MTRKLLSAAVVAGTIAPLLLLGVGQSAAQTPTPGPVSATALPEVGRVATGKASTSRIARSDPALLARTDAAPVAVVVKLDYDPAATYAGDVPGLAATSPSVTGTPLAADAAPVRAHDAYAAAAEQRFAAELGRIAPGARITQSLRTVYGGVALTVPAATAKALDAAPGVVAVQPDVLNQPLTDSSTDFLGTPALYTALGATAPNAGAGTILGNLDSGVWPEHPSFAARPDLPAPPPTASGAPRACEFGDNPRTPTADPFVCNTKLIGGAHFTDAYDVAVGDDVFPGTARDSNGHGSHTASTSAGNVVDDVSVLGSRLPGIQGLAPGAHVMEYKVCGPGGCFGSDSAAAVGQAVLDGVDVINFSISGGTNPYTDPVELAFLDAYAAGVFVAASAGNAGPGAGTANHVSPWVTTVAASTQTREFATTLTLTGAGGATFTVAGASITGGAGPAPVVLSSAAPYGSRLCDTPAAAGSLTGKIVACERGGNSRVSKGFNVREGGAVAMVLYNPTQADTGTDTHWLPAVHVADGRPMLAFLAANPTVTGAFPAGAPRDGRGDVIAAFSSRGPAGSWLKPDVTAPGVQILAADTPATEGVDSGPEGELFQAINGTSMSSPHVAGAALLLAALHPDWTPGQIRSALMTTARTAVVKQDLTTPADPFDHGAGRIDLAVAGNPGLTFDESAADMTLLGTNPVTAPQLNLPSINLPTVPGEVTVTRTATNVTDRPVVYTTSATAPAGSSIVVSPSRFVLQAGRSIDLKITTISLEPDGRQRFGEVALTPVTRGLPRLHLPVAFVPRAGDVAVTSSCVDPSVARGATTTCTVNATNNGLIETTVDLATAITPQARATAAQGATVRFGGYLVERRGTVVPPAKLGLPSVTPGSSPGFTDLATLGVAPIPIGDEELVKVDLPGTVVHAGVPYTRVSISSNGYVVMGDAGPEQNLFEPPTDAPDASPPNGFLAPFWTDLDGTGAAGVRAAKVTKAGVDYAVVQHDVNVFGRQDLRTFQTWMRIGQTEDNHLVYPADRRPTDPAGQAFVVGAENTAGQGAISATLPTGDLRVTSTSPSPAGTASYTITVRGQSRGTAVLATVMRSPVVPGTTVARTNLGVR